MKNVYVCMTVLYSTVCYVTVAVLATGKFTTSSPNASHCCTSIMYSYVTLKTCPNELLCTTVVYSVYCNMAIFCSGRGRLGFLHVLVL